MNVTRAEFAKLKRSLSWAVVLLLPALSVIAGMVNTLAAGEPLDQGWHTLWLRSVVFYGLVPLAVGIAVLTSLSWRAEHRDGNFAALLTTPVSGLRLVTAKTVVIAALVGLMQAVLLAVAVVAGKVVFGLSGMLPAQYWGISVLIAVSCVPVVAVQSGLSMLMRSFAAPIAAAFLGAGTAVAALLAELNALAAVLPYALISRATQLGTGTFADDGSVTAGTVTIIAVWAMVLTAVILPLSAVLLRRREV